MNQKEQLAGLIKQSKNTVFFGGAGVSTESGIPDFRSESGLYAARQVYGHPPEELLSYSMFKRKPGLFFRYHKENLIARDAKPNAAHLALAELERRGKLKAVVTQNVDGLHQKAGSKVVHELHGSCERNHCMDCGALYDFAYMLDDAHCTPSSYIARCEVCGGIVKPDVVLYEEPLDEKVMHAAIKAIQQADTLIVGGTSLVVYPAAGFVDLFRGMHLVIINKDETDRDTQATLIIREPIGAFLSKVVV